MLELVGARELRFDPYPFIFLTLMLSLQASYAAPLILLAQNRQEDRDRVIAEQDRQANARAHADMEFLAREVASLRMAARRGGDPRLPALGAARPARRPRRAIRDGRTSAEAAPRGHADDRRRPSPDRCREPAGPAARRSDVASGT